ncbi:MAG: ion channel [Pseudomonadota bacterium]
MSDLTDQGIASVVIIASTTFIHAVFIALAAALIRAGGIGASGSFRVFRDTILLVMVALILSFAHALEIGIWAGAFLRLQIFNDLETALYFSAVSYTTLGFGDLIVERPWRLLSGAAAANGLLLFGLSAAFLAEISVKLRLSGDR